MKYNLVDYYGPEDYRCPYCGCESSDCKSNDNWGFICKDCGEEFETPDV